MSNQPTGLFGTTAFLGLTMMALAAAHPLGAAESDGAVGACPLPPEDSAEQVDNKPAVRRLRATLASGVEGNSIDADLAELAFVTSARPNPQVQEILQVPGDDRTSLQITVVNNSRHASPDGGITLSFPDFTRPSDRERIDDVVVPEGMALHVIPAGGELFGRNGVAQVARHLMIEVHGSWRPRQTRSLELDVLGTMARVVVQYRSALSDNGGDYHNTPAESDALDQQGWPAFACVVGSGDSDPAEDQRATAQATETGGRQ